MLKISTGLAFLIFAINFEQDYSSYEVKSLVSAEPVQNQKHVHNEIQGFKNLDDDERDEEDEVLGRVKRSPDPKPQPRGRGGGFRGGSRFSGGSSGSSGGGNLSTGAILGIVFGILGGCFIFWILTALCC
uniref:Uncharacterized protein n=1 Tax=Clytia hemisphaerica TaxID=252671 RepID=A0A7M5VEA7_9CNID